MTRTLNILATMATIMLMSSFTDKNTNAFIGTYGVPDSDPAQIQLTLHADHTFYYQDFSAPDKKIVIQGQWTQKGKNVVLKGNHPTKKFHDVWSFVENGQVAKSRKGLTFYRLCKIDG